MRTFIAIGRKTGLRLVLRYDYSGVLRAVEFDGNWTDELIHRIKPRLPENVQYCISQIKGQGPNSPWKFTEETDTSFEAFYKQYPNKLGKKQMAEKAWEKLTAAAKTDAILYLGEYLPKKAKEGTNVPYASSYINGKYWEQ